MNMSVTKPPEIPSVVSKKLLKVHRQNGTEAFLLNERMKTLDMKQNQRYIEIDLEKDLLSKSIERIQSVRQNPGLSTERRKLLKSKGFTISVMAGDPEDEILLKRQSLQLQAGNWASLLSRPPSAEQNTTTESKEEQINAIPRPQTAHTPRRSEEFEFNKKRRPFSADFVFGSRIRHKFRDIEPPEKPGSRRNFIQISEDSLQKIFAKSITEDSEAVKEKPRGNANGATTRQNCEKNETFDGDFMSAVILKGGTAKEAHFSSRKKKKVSINLNNSYERRNITNGCTANGARVPRRSNSAMTSAELLFHKDRKRARQVDSGERVDPEKTLESFFNSLPAAKQNNLGRQCDSNRSLNVKSSDEVHSDQGLSPGVQVNETENSKHRMDCYGSVYHQMKEDNLNSITLTDASKDEGKLLKLTSESTLLKELENPTMSPELRARSFSLPSTSTKTDSCPNKNQEMLDSSSSPKEENVKRLQKPSCGDFRRNKREVCDGKVLARNEAWVSSHSNNVTARSGLGNANPGPLLGNKVERNIARQSSKGELLQEKQVLRRNPKVGNSREKQSILKNSRSKQKFSPNEGNSKKVVAETGKKDEVVYAYDARPGKSLSKGYTTMQMTVGGRQVKVCIPSFPAEAANVRPRQQSARSIQTM